MSQKFRFATFNCENLFSRPKAMNTSDPTESRDVLDDFQTLDALISHETYSDADKQKMIELLLKYQFDNKNLLPDAREIKINEVRDKLFTSSQRGVIKITAKGRSSWVGWFDLTRTDLAPTEVLNTGRVVQLVNADIQLLIETEDRIAIDKFNKQVLRDALGMTPFEHNLLVDGNDPRGIDIGLLSRFPINSVRSHIGDGGLNKPIFSRDCPEYEVTLKGGKTVWVMGNHLKSKLSGTGNTDARRKKQAEQVKKIYEVLRKTHKYVIVAGDFNDFPDSEPLKAILKDTDLQDVMSHPKYLAQNSLPGTYDTCTSIQKKIDYVLLSPALWAGVKNVGVERSGIWAPVAFKKAGIAIMPTVTSDKTSASDHAAVWVDLEI